MDVWERVINRWTKWTLMSDNTDTMDGNGEQPTDDAEERIAEIREKDSLSRLFVKSNAKIISALLTSPRDMTATSLAESAGINRTTVYEQRDVLLELGIIEQTRTEGGSPMYDIADTETAEAVEDLQAVLV